MTLAYTDATRTGPIAVVFEAAKAKSALAAFTFETTDGCATSGEWQLGGYLTGEVEVAHKLVEVGKEPAAAKALQVTFPGTMIKNVWIEKSGALEEKKVGLLTDGAEPENRGGLGVELASGAEWGVFT